MSVLSPYFYLLMMPIFLLEGWLLSRVLPFHREQNKAQLEQRRLVPLDGLRGILALSVFFLHAAEFYQSGDRQPWFPSTVFLAQLGVMAVSLFFFITGFLFWRKLASGRSFEVGQFLYGRFARLSGVYFLVCFTCFGLLAWVSGFQRNVSLAKLVAQLISWMGYFGAGHDLNGIAWSRLWLGPAWTLGYEWLFYLSLPFLGWFAARKSRIPLLILLGVIIGHGLNMLHPHNAVAHWLSGFIATYAGFLGTVFSVGIITAALDLPERVVTWLKGPVATLLSFALLLLAATRLNPTYGWKESLVLAFPFICIRFGNDWFGLLHLEGTRFLGRVSYSFYLLHVVLLEIEFRIFKPVGAVPFLVFVALSGLLTILVSAFTYRYLEFPFQHVRLGRLLPTRTRSAALEEVAATT